MTDTYFFRSLTCMRFSPETAADLADIEAALAQHTLRPCGPLEQGTRGFVPPSGVESDGLVLRTATGTLITVGSEDKLLPTSVINAAIDKKVAAIQQREGRKVGAKERRSLKDAVTTELLPKAFVKGSHVDGYLDLAGGWLVVDTSSKKKAEDFGSQIRKAVGRFPAVPLLPEESPRALLTDWLTSGDLPEGLTLGEECELRDPAEAGAIWRGRRSDLQCDEVMEHLKAGKQVFQLALQFQDRLGFVLGEDLSIRKLRFLDVAMADLDVSDVESVRDELSACFTLMVGELAPLLAALVDWFDLAAPIDQA